MSDQGKTCPASGKRIHVLDIIGLLLLLAGNLLFAFVSYPAGIVVIVAGVVVAVIAMLR